MRFAALFSKNIRYAAPLCFLTAVVAPGVVAGCGGVSGSSICNASCDCMGCSTTAHETCVMQIDDSLKESDDVGCGDLANTFLSCVQNNSTCIGAQFKTGGCDVETQKFGNCLISAKCVLIGLQVHCA